MSASRPRVGVVILTMGKRPRELAQAVESVREQRDVDTDIVVVGNGWKPTDLPRGVRGLHLPQNRGIPAGRNAGVPHVTGNMLLFLDDDAQLAQADFLIRCLELLAARPDIGAIQPRVDTVDESPAPRRWIPRIRKGNPRRSSTCMLLWEGTVVMPREVFDDVGGWGEPYFYAHEGIELAWRVWNQGLVAWYAGDLLTRHPLMQPTRHDDYYRLNARNRVWLARRNLPPVMGVIYVMNWALIQHLRWVRAPHGLRQWWRGLAEGLRNDPGGRRPLRARTLARMWRAGRAPFV